VQTVNYYAANSEVSRYAGVTRGVRCIYCIIVNTVIFCNMLRLDLGGRRWSVAPALERVRLCYSTVCLDCVLRVNVPQQLINYNVNH